MKWTPCSERLPERDGNYLIQVNFEWGAEFEIGEWSNGMWWNDNRHVNVAWMPLPEPYDSADMREKGIEPQTNAGQNTQSIKPDEMCRECRCWEKCSTEDWRECRYEPKDEAQTEVCDRPDQNCEACWKKLHCRAKDEPQTDCAWK